MPHSRIHSAWTEEECELIKAMVAAGTSAARVAVALKRRLISVKSKARDLGCPFPHERQLGKVRRKVLSGTPEAARWPLHRTTPATPTGRRRPR